MLAKKKTYVYVRVSVECLWIPSFSCCAVQMPHVQEEVGAHEQDKFFNIHTLPAGGHVRHNPDVNNNNNNDLHINIFIQYMYTVLIVTFVLLSVLLHIRKQCLYTCSLEVLKYLLSKTRTILQRLQSYRDYLSSL